MQAQTESPLFILTVINGRDLVSSRCIKGRKKEKREVTFLPSSQVPLRASIFLFIFLSLRQVGTGYEYGGGFPKKVP